jgi:hypothetical protein
VIDLKCVRSNKKRESELWENLGAT